MRLRGILRQAAFLMLALSLSGPSVLSAQCATSDRGATNSVAFVWLIPQGWPNGDSSAVSSAAQAWNSTCGGYGSQDIPELWLSTSQPPGTFSVLDRDGWVTLSDTRWNELKLWIDQNHDGRCLASETRSLASEGVVGIELAYRQIGRMDVHGNEFRLMSRALFSEENGTVMARKIYDVYFLTSPAE